MSTPPADRLQAVFFDLDGTLIDSEPLTERLVERLLGEHSLPPPAFPLSRFHGVTWDGIAAMLVDSYPSLADAGLAGRLQRDFHALLESSAPPFVPGAQQAFASASRTCPTGVVSSSQRESISAVLQRAGLADACRVMVGAEDVRRGKPDPECYLLAAQRVPADPAHCLVFEDSEAGLAAARAAGMHTLGVRGSRDAQAAVHLARDADQVIADFEDLPPDFFAAFRTAR